MRNDTHKYFIPRHESGHVTSHMTSSKDNMTHALPLKRTREKLNNNNCWAIMAKRA